MTTTEQDKELREQIHKLFGDHQAYDGGYHSCYDGKWIDMTNEVCAVADFITADRKKHELEAKKNGFYMAAGLFGADISRVEELWYKCEQELEKL